MLILLLCYTFVTQEKKFLHIGKLMAGALAQGGSGFPIFSPCVYSYMKGSDIDGIAVSVEEVPDYEVRDVIAKVHTYTLPS